MIETLGERIWSVNSGVEGPSFGISFGVHGDERAPIDAGLALKDELESGALALERGRLLLFHGNPRATEENRRATAAGVDLNRCFHPSVLGREPELLEEHRAREIAAAIESTGCEALVDFHCTVEPGQRFLMQHPPVADEAHQRVFSFLRAEILLSDPDMNFGGVSLDEYMSTRGRVGICYETGWLGDPANTPESAGEEMRNLLAGMGLISSPEAKVYGSKRLLEMVAAQICEEEGFRWDDGIGQNLQALDAGTRLGAYASGREITLDRDTTLIFPKKRPELMVVGKPLVYLSVQR